MPSYQLRFLVESPLSGALDYELQLDGTAVRLLLGSAPNEIGFEAEVVADGTNFDKAYLAAEAALYRTLDATALHNKGSMLVRDNTLALKSQPGAVRRKARTITARYERERVEPWAPRNDIQQTIDTAAPALDLALFWLRTGYTADTILERFMYIWLALETLAGRAKRVPKCQRCQTAGWCPNCREELQEYSSADRDAGFALVQAADVSITKQEFNRWWNDLRNKVFHGGKRLDGAFLSELSRVGELVRSAVEKAIYAQVGIRHEMPARPFGVLSRERLFIFMEFDAVDSAEAFASRIPDAQRIQALIAAGESTEKEMNCRLLRPEEFYADF